MSHIIPKGKIAAVSANMSHKISFNGKNLVRHGEVLPSVDLKKAADQFISFLRKLETDNGSKPGVSWDRHDHLDEQFCFSEV